MTAEHPRSATAAIAIASQLEPLSLPEAFWVTSYVTAHLVHRLPIPEREHALRVIADAVRATLTSLDIGVTRGNA